MVSNIKMAFFAAGLLVGAYAGAMFREDYNFPTIENLKTAAQVFRKEESNAAAPAPPKIAADVSVKT
jgi:hypothetical protein